MQESERKYKWYYSPKCTFKNEKKTGREKTMVSVLTRAKKCAKISFVFEKVAGVAQSVEQLIRNQQVAGSSPASSSKGRDNLCLLFFIFLKRISKFNSQQKISLRYEVRFCLFIRFEMFQKNI